MLIDSTLVPVTRWPGFRMPEQAAQPHPGPYPPPMTRGEWIQARLADAPPLSPAQMAALRQLFRPVLSQKPATEPPAPPGSGSADR
jgi:hypothetical protein